MSSVLSPPEIELAEVDHHAFNLAVWSRLSESPELADLDYRIETDKHGQLIMSPPAAPWHGNRQGKITHYLHSLSDSGEIIPECPISTSEGVKAADVAWCSDSVWNSLEGQSCFVKCPELCVEVLSPSNTKSEIAEKKRLYFECGAKEVWICDLEGRLIFYNDDDCELGGSRLFPEFPKTI